MRKLSQNYKVLRAIGNWQSENYWN